ncbi:hypothetical protein ACLKA7_014348 [Drosophila subpalustris]
MKYLFLRVFEVHWFPQSLSFCLWPSSVRCVVLCCGLEWSGVAGTPLSAMCDLLRRALSFERDSNLMAVPTELRCSGGRGMHRGEALDRRQRTVFHLRLIAVDVSGFCGFGFRFGAEPNTGV